jgi:hypothetical protein
MVTDALERGRLEHLADDAGENVRSAGIGEPHAGNSRARCG